MFAIISLFKFTFYLLTELSGTGRLEKLSTVAKGTKYTPKIPFPTECYSHIDAALQVKGESLIHHN